MEHPLPASGFRAVADPLERRAFGKDFRRRLTGVDSLSLSLSLFLCPFRVLVAPEAIDGHAESVSGHRRDLAAHLGRQLVRKIWDDRSTTSSTSAAGGLCSSGRSETPWDTYRLGHFGSPKRFRFCRHVWDDFHFDLGRYEAQDYWDAQYWPVIGTLLVFLEDS